MDANDFLKLLKEYIEEMEGLVDADRGEGKGIEALIRDARMPGIYYEVLSRLNWSGLL